VPAKHGGVAFGASVDVKDCGGSPLNNSVGIEVYGFSSRLGLVFAAIHGEGLAGRAGGLGVQRFPSKQSNGVSLKGVPQQSVVPMIGISYSH